MENLSNPEKDWRVELVQDKLIQVGSSSAFDGNRIEADNTQPDVFAV